MADLQLEHIHEDLETLKKEVAVIVHILSEEGELSEDAKKRLAEARKTSRSEYIEFN